MTASVWSKPQQDFARFWPDSSALVDVPMIDHLVNEARTLAGTEEISQRIRSGELGIISGVSARHVDLQIDMAVHHRWHLCFRRYGAHVLVDIVYEPCDGAFPTGVDDLVYLDAIDATEAELAAESTRSE